MAEVAGLTVTKQPQNLDAARLFDLFGVTPVPTENLFVQLFAWLVIVFGVGYFWISRDPVTNVPIIKLGMLGKASVVLVCLAAVMMHTVSWQLLILASADLVYAVFFFGAQHDQKSGWRVIVSRRLALLTA